jgi:hypothetical protein
VRVSSAERDEVASALARHYADGRLTLGEYEERVATALEARTGADLDAVLTDLPASPRPSARAAARPSRPGPSPSGPPLRSPRPVHGPGPFTHAGVGPGPSVVRIAAIALVVTLAFATSMWALWLLWPVLAFTGGGACGRHGAPRHHDVAPSDRATPVDA